MLTWLGGGLHRARWGVVLFSLVLAVAMGWYGFRVFDTLRGMGLEDPKSESIVARDLINETFAQQAKDTDDMLLLLSSDKYAATDPEFVGEATKLTDTLKVRKEVLSIQSYYLTKSEQFLSTDGRETFMLVELSTKDGATKTYRDITGLLKSPTLDIKVGGSLATDVQFNDQLRHDLEFAETVVLPIVALMLVFIFGGVVAALLPLLIGGFAIVGSFAILHILTYFIQVSSFATNVVTIIGLGLAIDYSLFIVTRFREEFARDETDVRGALQRTMATAGRTILFSGLTVCTSLLGLLLFPQGLLRSIGIATICSAFVAMLGSLTVLPALLGLLGKRVNALSIQRFFRKRQRTVDTQQGVWYRLSYFVMRWSVPVALLSIIFLLLLGSPFLHASFSSADERSIPTHHSARIVIDRLKEKFPNQNNSQITIAVRTDGKVTTNENLQKLDTYVGEIKGLSHIKSVSSAVSLDPRLNLQAYQQLYANPQANPQITEAAKQVVKDDVTRIIITSDLAPHSAEVEGLVKEVRGLAVPEGFTRYVGGREAQEIDQFASLGAAIPYALGVMAVAIFVLLFLMTGSLLIPLKAIILNVLSLTATFGALVWVFQDGHLQDVLGFKAFGSLDSTQPILIFAIAFGLSMDYEVFLLSRIKEQFDKTGNNSEAVAVGLQRTGWLITSAALLLAVVVGAFATSRIIQIQEIGVGLALAIVMDATIVRGLLVPSMMKLLGDWNWWAPRPLQVLWKYVGLREPSEVEVEKEREVAGV